MDATPRLRSAFPSTPIKRQKINEQDSFVPKAWKSHTPQSNLINSASDASEPLIPFTVADAPSQRLYVSSFYLGLTLWRLYDFSSTISDETDSLWLFMKWVAIDTAFLYGLPALKIPWMQWSSSTVTALFLLHGALNALLMFRISIPLESWFIAVVKLFYDRELAIAEIRVKPASIIQNSSLILGKQIVHILPEGSVMLNPYHTPACLVGPKSHVKLPIRINQTNPIYIELLRVDLDTNLHETITISGKELSKLKKQADKANAKDHGSKPRHLEYIARDTGLYRLQKVVDESKLEVRRIMSDTFVVECPSGSVKSAVRDKCKGELSDLYLEVKATPPIKIKYSRSVNQEDDSHAILSVHPETIILPPTHQENSEKMAALELEKLDFSWARTQITKVPLNESLGISGIWRYVIEEVHDAHGNIANYTNNKYAKSGLHEVLGEKKQEQMFLVHERPKIALHGYDSQNPLKAPKGQSRLLPLQLTSTAGQNSKDSRHAVSYLFTPYADLSPSQEHAHNATLKQIKIHESDRGFEVQEPGLYTLMSISTQFCRGEIMEPSSCLFLNPPEPDLEISAENIPDKCAGSSIGFVVDLGMIGTPPFRISYTIRRNNEKFETPKTIDIGRHQTQIDLTPSRAGHYLYKFTQISDSVYRVPRSLEHKGLVLEQDVKPPAFAMFREAWPVKMACMEQSVSVDIEMRGEPPWALEYEISHNGRREKYTKSDITNTVFTLVTPKLNSGGDHSLILKSVTDKTKCKVLLEQEATIEVALQKPKASFGQIDGKRNISALEGRRVSIPLRLQGESPWVITYRNLDDPKDRTVQKVVNHGNDRVEVNAEGVYEIVSVHDASCPGSVEMSAKQFIVHWVPRPRIYLAETSLFNVDSGTYVKKDVCEGDEDATDIYFAGTAPYTVEYHQYFEPNRGPQSKRSQLLTSGLKSASFKMDTSKSGLYKYEFSKLGDGSYGQTSLGSESLTIKQQVRSRPTARFTENGKTYKYCKEETGDEMIPITLIGQSPFHLEIDIRHHATTKPEIVNIPQIDKNQYEFRIPHRILALGTHVVTIRKVQDSHGCQQHFHLDAPHIQVSVAESPSISPLETSKDFCVGERISYALSGTPPFHVFYKFQDIDRKAVVPTTNFRRLAEKPGEFVITGVSDQRSTDACKARMSIKKIIHEMPSVRISKGKTATVDIHEGGEAEILFEFGGTPPFEFSYTRSSNPPKGKKSEILETKNEVSYEYTKILRASDEGVYEVVSIKDKFCAFSKQRAKEGQGRPAKLLTY